MKAVVQDRPDRPTSCGPRTSTRPRRRRPLGAQAAEALLRGGSGRSDGGGDGAARDPRRRPRAAGPPGAGRRSRGRGRPPRRPDRRRTGRGGHGGVQQGRRRVRPVAGRRARRRPHRSRRHRRAAAVRRRARRSREPAAAPGAGPDGHARPRRRRRTGPRLRSDRIDPAGGRRRGSGQPAVAAAAERPDPGSSTGPPSLADTAAGLHRVEQGHTRGEVVVTVP